MPSTTSPRTSGLVVAGQGEADLVDVGRAEDVAVLDALEDRVPLGAGRDQAAGRLLAVAAVVLDPGLAEDLPAEAALPALAVPGVAGVRLALP